MGKDESFQAYEQRVLEMVRKESNNMIPKKWRVWYQFYSNMELIDEGTKNFTVSSRADEYIQYLRKLATIKNYGIYVKKIDIRHGIKSKNKTWKKGYRRKW